MYLPKLGVPLELGLHHFPFLENQLFNFASFRIVLNPQNKPQTWKKKSILETTRVLYPNALSYVATYDGSQPINISRHFEMIIIKSQALNTARLQYRAMHRCNTVLDPYHTVHIAGSFLVTVLAIGQYSDNTPTHTLLLTSLHLIYKAHIRGSMMWFHGCRRHTSRTGHYCTSQSLLYFRDGSNKFSSTVFVWSSLLFSLISFYV